ncbi:hypothetical protein CDAR_381351 [Caerostris darwini]|uniref:Uncharacterized protein n=1 Tax=Caerostris darwini TaxID=1538125 RepID=A0AAV4MH18_9ARAC|nr:hypothetical protein CDAR_381351 [Caerostris darwini]
MERRAKSDHWPFLLSSRKKRRNEVLALHPLAARTLRFSAPAGHPHFPPAEENAPAPPHGGRIPSHPGQGIRRGLEAQARSAAHLREEARLRQGPDTPAGMYPSPHMPVHAVRQQDDATYDASHDAPYDDDAAHDDDASNDATHDAPHGSQRWR